MLRILVGIALSLCLACGGPTGPFPGGRLSGEELPYPMGGFSFAADEERIAVEVGSSSPHSVHTWAVVLGETLFVPADFFNPGKKWPHLAMADSQARIRIDGRVYPCRLVRVTETERIDQLRRATAKKYDIAEDSWAADIEVWWFRVDPRRNAHRTDRDR